MTNNLDINTLLDGMEKQYSLTKAYTDPRARATGCVSTGLLTLDLMLGGGYIGGSWVTFLGMEQSAKSTAVTTAMASLAINGVQGCYFDYEGSSDPSFQDNIASDIGKLISPESKLTASKLFGVMNESTGKYIQVPIFRLYSESIGDVMFDSLAALVRKLPDKVFENGKWYYVYDKKPEGKINRKLSSRGNYYVEASNPHPEIAFIVDSYPAMYPEKLEEGGGQGMAAVARMFSENIPKIAGKLRKKGILIIGVNQLRLRPGVTFQNPEYEPAGEAVKFISHVRIKNTARSVPHGKGKIEEEPSVLDSGSDQYRYIHLQAIKNKQASSAGLSSWQRVWVADPNGQAHGFDPVWNIYDYLVTTGQATRFGSGKKRTVLFSIRDTKGEKIIFDASLDWYDFKALILFDDESAKKQLAKDLMSPKQYKTLFITSNNLFNHCREQILSGAGKTLAYQVLNGVDELEEVDEEDGDDEE